MARALKSRPKTPWGLRLPRWTRVLGLCASCVCFPATALGQSILLGFRPPPPSPAPVDPRLPTGGPRFLGSERPDDRGAPPVCSFRWPVCVHPAPGAADSVVLGLLAAAESAMDTLLLALDLPAPAPDAGAGGRSALDLYLQPGDPGVELVPEAVRFGTFDSAGGYCLVGSVDPSGLDRAATLCVAEAIAARLDPAATPHVRRAYATHLWWIAGAPSDQDVLAVSNAQLQPQSAVFGSELRPATEGAALVFEYLESKWAPSTPGDLATMVLALAGSHTEPGAWRWHDEPDVLDVLRATFQGRPMSLPVLLGDFAVSRALLGRPGSVLSLARWSGELGDLRADKTIALSTLPRHVAFDRPVEPTGMTSFWIPFDVAAPGELTLGLRVEWEAPVAFQWIVVRVKPDGTEDSRVTIPFQERGTSAQQRVVNLDGLSGLLLVGTNMGGVDLAHPFDPDVAPYEPSGGTLYLGRL